MVLVQTRYIVKLDHFDHRLFQKFHRGGIPQDPSRQSRPIAKNGFNDFQRYGNIVPNVDIVEYGDNA